VAFWWFAWSRARDLSCDDEALIVADRDGPRRIPWPQVVGVRLPWYGLGGLAVIDTLAQAPLDRLPFLLPMRGSWQRGPDPLQRIREEIERTRSGR
jgi:hypothetical protein